MGKSSPSPFPVVPTDDATTILSLLAETMPDGQTFSAGHTTMQAGESVAATLDRADTLLYTAKRHGRDRIITDHHTR